MFFAAPIRVLGRRNVPQSGSLLILANHLSNTDPVLVQYSSPRLIHFMARRELFQMGALGRFVAWFKAFPVKQSSADKGAIRTAVELLKAGRTVCVFPEGQLSPDGNLIPLLPGAALVVRMSGAPCVCVGIRGSNRVMPDPSVVPRWAFSRVTLTWGQPRAFPHDASAEEILGWIDGELRQLSGQA
jgi:1-acyl-sn-glycerol-3-phosphate acyltransferase